MMKKPPTQTSELRSQAEKILAEKVPPSPEGFSALSLEEIQRTVHELSVHQIELELQNEDLRLRQAELTVTRERYFELYDLAPVGYLTINEQSLILEANLAAAGWLGVTRKVLTRHLLTRFILEEDQDIYYQHRKNLLETSNPQAIDLRMLKIDGTIFWAHMTTNTAQDTNGLRVYRIILNDITERKWAEVSLQQSSDELKMAYDSTLQGWSIALEMREHETAGHSRRVVNTSLILARSVGVKEEELIQIQRGALLHDIGKMGIPDSILLKPGPLDDQEWVVMRQHPYFADRLLSSIPYLEPALDIPHYHHEKWDGTGYPYGLEGEKIPLAARVFAVVDVWDALSYDRPYRTAWSEKDIVQYLQDQSGKHFDPYVLDAFLSLLAKAEIMFKAI